MSRGNIEKGRERDAARVLELGPAEVEKLIAGGGIRLVDVRQGVEHWLERIPGSELVPLGELDAERWIVDAERTILYCRSGARSLAAASAVSRASGKAVRHLAGGILAWKAAGHPIERWGKGGGAK